MLSIEHFYWRTMGRYSVFRVMVCRCRQHSTGGSTEFPTEDRVVQQVPGWVFPQVDLHQVFFTVSLTCDQKLVSLLQNQKTLRIVPASSLQHQQIFIAPGQSFPNRVGTLYPHVIILFAKSICLQWRSSEQSTQCSESSAESSISRSLSRSLSHLSRYEGTKDSEVGLVIYRYVKRHGMWDLGSNNDPQRDYLDDC